MKHVFAFSMLIPLSHAEASTDTLEKQATEYGNLKIVPSKSTDPIGVADLWGMEDFIVAASCEDTSVALSDIPPYPQYTSSVKKIEVIEQTETSLTVDYTEEGYQEITP